MPVIRNISIIIFFAFALLGTEAFASAGHVIYSFGNNYLVNKKGNKHGIRKGDEVFSGDTLITSQHGRVQLRFSDKGMVSIMPDSEYKIDDYEFVPGDDNKQRGFFSLLRGGARQITGLLSRIRHEHFRFRTAVATIGIRGTGFYVRLCKANCYDGNGNLLPDGMYVKNDTGIITMSNDGGEIELAQGQSAFSANHKDAPKQVYEPPAPYNVASNDINLGSFDFSIGNAIGPSYTLTTNNPPPTPVITLNSMTSAFIGSVDGLSPSGAVANTSTPGESITQLANSNDISAYVGDDGFLNPATFDSSGAKLVESGFNPTYGVAWSRWTGAYSVTAFGSPVATLGDIHLIGAAQLTPSLPTSGLLSYQSIGGTSPTFIGPSGTTLVGTQSIAFDINYNTASITNVTINATFAGGSIAGGQSGGATAPITITGVSNNIVPVTATCISLCALAQNGATMDGSLSINLVGANGAGAFGAYGLSNSQGGTVTPDASVVGSYLAVGK